MSCRDTLPSRVGPCRVSAPAKPRWIALRNFSNGDCLRGGFGGAALAISFSLASCSRRASSRSPKLLLLVLNEPGVGQASKSGQEAALGLATVSSSSGSNIADAMVQWLTPFWSNSSSGSFTFQGWKWACKRALGMLRGFRASTALTSSSVLPMSPSVPSLPSSTVRVYALFPDISFAATDFTCAATRSPFTPQNQTQSSLFIVGSHSPLSSRTLLMYSSSSSSITRWSGSPGALCFSPRSSSCFESSQPGSPIRTVYTALGWSLCSSLAGSDMCTV